MNVVRMAIARKVTSAATYPILGCTAYSHKLCACVTCANNFNNTAPWSAR